MSILKAPTLWTLSRYLRMIKEEDMAKKQQEIQVPVNTALQANITPIGIEFERNALMLGENYCRIYGIIN